MTCVKRSRRIWLSIAGPATIAASARWRFSGEIDGLVMRYVPLGSGTSVSTKNSAAPFISG